jgi:sensor domain CHASE-containing protein
MFKNTYNVVNAFFAHVSLPFLLNFMLSYVEHVHIELTCRIYIYILQYIYILCGFYEVLNYDV